MANRAMGIGIVALLGLLTGARGKLTGRPQGFARLSRRVAGALGGLVFLVAILTLEASTAIILTFSIAAVIALLRWVAGSQLRSPPQRRVREHVGRSRLSARRSSQLPNEIGRHRRTSSVICPLPRTHATRRVSDGTPMSQRASCRCPGDYIVALCKRLLRGLKYYFRGGRFHLMSGTLRKKRFSYLSEFCISRDTSVAPRRDANGA